MTRLLGSFALLPENRCQNPIDFMRGRHDRSLDFASLEQALLVLDLGSFRKAAEVLQTPPSAVSRRIRALEDRIGISLFHRQTHGVYPTKAGMQLLKRIRWIVDESHLIVRAGELAGEGLGGSLCLGIIGSIAGGAARQLLRDFLVSHREISFNVVEGSSRDHIGEVQALRMDAAIVAGRPLAPGCVLETLWTEPIMVSLPDTHGLAPKAAVSWRELNEERFLVSKIEPGPELHDYIVNHLATLGYHPEIDPRDVGRDGLLALVGLGLGITLVSGAEAEVAYPGVVFRPLSGETVRFSLVWSERNDNPVLRRFMSSARTWAARRQVAAHEPHVSDG